MFSSRLYRVHWQGFKRLLTCASKKQIARIMDADRSGLIDLEERLGELSISLTLG